VRISERKRQLRDIADSPEALAARQVQRAEHQARPATRKGPRQARGSVARSGSSAPSTAGSPRTRKPRGAGFYAGFGFFGLFFAVLLAGMTVTTYRGDNDKYPAKLQQYHSAQAAYTGQLARYHQAVQKHAKPAPVAPKVPVVPKKPALDMASFALPGLYGLLSLAYLYLAYRSKHPRAKLGNSGRRL
jgi:hypothetical protein